jgi:hypothetical protein
MREARRLCEGIVEVQVDMLAGNGAEEEEENEEVKGTNETDDRSGAATRDAVRHDSSARYYFFFGTLAPFLRASERPMAIACFRLVTLPPFPPLPERSVPRFSRCRALLTLFPAA